MRPFFRFVVVHSAILKRESEDQMLQAQLTPANSISGAVESNSINSVPTVTRYQYSKRGRTCLKFVIVDVFPDGYEDFSDQEAGEVCWYRFRPTTAERAAFHEFIKSQQLEDRWPLLNI